MADADFTMKTHDRLPAIEAQLFDPKGDPVSLVGATVTFIMRTAPERVNDPTAVKVDATATVVQVSTGVVRYDWKSADTDVPGMYDAEWEVRWSDGRKQTFPTATYHSIAILADLDEE